MSLIFHPLLALIASVTDLEPARYVGFLKEENKILRSRVPGQRELVGDGARSGLFRIIIRRYMPEEAAIDGSWKQGDLQEVG